MTTVVCKKVTIKLSMSALALELEEGDSMLRVRHDADGLWVAHSSTDELVFLPTHELQLVTFAGVREHLVPGPT